MNFIYAWTVAHFHDPKEKEKFILELMAPEAGIDPDEVPEEVVAEEMSLFYTLKRQTSPGGA